MSDELEPLSPRLRALLQKERSVPLDVPKAAQERLLGVLRAAGPAGGGPGHAHEATPDAGADAPALPPAAPAVASWTAAKSLLLAAATGAVGFAGGLAVTPAKAPVSPVVVTPVEVPAPAEVEEPTAPVDAGRVPAQPAPEAPKQDRGRRVTREQPVSAPELVPAPPPVPAPVANDDAPDVQRASERQLIDAARVALGRNRAHDALVFLMGHERRFPEGVFVEERELMVVEAFAAQGRGAQAAARGKAFLARFPRSAHAARVRSLLDKP